MHLTMPGLRQIFGGTVSAIWGEQRHWESRRRQILMYHSIGGHAAGDTKGLYSIDPRKFLEQMNFLYELQRTGKIRVVPFGKEEPGCVSITFDDGYVDNLTVAAPILEKLDLPFHIFITPDFITKRQVGFLTVEQVKLLAKHDLVTLGIHGYTHKPLTEHSPLELVDQISRATQWLSDTTGKSVTTLSYPHGKVNNFVTQVVAECGITHAACSKFGPVRPNSDLRQLPRIDIWSTDSKRSFAGKIAGRWDWLQWRT